MVQGVSGPQNSCSAMRRIHFARCCMKTIRPERMARITRMTLFLFVFAAPASVIGQEMATSGRAAGGAIQQGHQDPASAARVISEGTTLRLNLPDALRISKLKPDMKS